MVIVIKELRLLHTSFQSETIAQCNLVALNVIYTTFNHEAANLLALRIMMNHCL